MEGYIMMPIKPKNSSFKGFEKTTGKTERITKVSWNGNLNFGIQLSNGQSIKVGDGSHLNN
jgi:hypothetical protein